MQGKFKNESQTIDALWLEYRLPPTPQEMITELCEKYKVEQNKPFFTAQDYIDIAYLKLANYSDKVNKAYDKWSEGLEHNLHFAIHLNNYDKFKNILLAHNSAKLIPNVLAKLLEYECYKYRYISGISLIEAAGYLLKFQGLINEALSYSESFGQYAEGIKISSLAFLIMLKVLLKVKDHTNNKSLEQHDMALESVVRNFKYNGISYPSYYLKTYLSSFNVPTDSNALFVDQGYYGISNGKMLGTNNIATCIALAVKIEGSKYFALMHVDTSSTKQVIIGLLEWLEKIYKAEHKVLDTQNIKFLARIFGAKGLYDNQDPGTTNASLINFRNVIKAIDQIGRVNILSTDIGERSLPRALCINSDFSWQLVQPDVSDLSRILMHYRCVHSINNSAPLIVWAEDEKVINIPFLINSELRDKLGRYDRQENYLRSQDIVSFLEAEASRGNNIFYTGAIAEGFFKAAEQLEKTVKENCNTILEHYKNINISNEDKYCILNYLRRLVFIGEGAELFNKATFKYFSDTCLSIRHETLYLDTKKATNFVRTIRSTPLILIDMEEKFARKLNL